MMRTTLLTLCQCILLDCGVLCVIIQKTVLLMNWMVEGHGQAEGGLLLEFHCAFLVLRVKSDDSDVSV